MGASALGCLSKWPHRALIHIIMCGISWRTKNIYIFFLKSWKFFEIMAKNCFLPWNLVSFRTNRPPFFGSCRNPDELLISGSTQNILRCGLTERNFDIWLTFLEIRRPKWDNLYDEITDKFCLFRPFSKKLINISKIRSVRPHITIN